MTEPTAVITDDLVSRWKLNEDLGSTVYDDTGSKDGTLYNSPTRTTNDVGDTAIQFNGSNQYALIGSSTTTYNFIHQTLVFTLCAWMKLDLPAAEDVFLVLGATPSTSEKGVWFAFENRNPAVRNRVLRLIVSKGSVGNPCFNDSPGANVITDANWHHVAVSVNNASGAVFYVDGASVGSAARSQTPGTGNATRNLVLAATNSSSGITYHSDGALSDIRIYDRALSATEIAAIADHRG